MTTTTGPKTKLQHDQLSSITPDQHHDQKHNLSSTSDHSGKLNESLISYSNPPLHSHIGKIKVKQENSKETQERPLIEFIGRGSSSVSVVESSQYNKVIVTVSGTDVTTFPATTVESETTFGQTPVVGTSSLYSREDHTHGTPACPFIPAAASTVTDETTFSISPAAGTSTNYAREDHTHGSPVDPVIAHEITYNHANLPTSDQKAALAGTSGTPSVTNKYVTNADSRNSDARIPVAHGSAYHVGTCCTWLQIDKTSSNIADITTRSHTSLTDIGTTSHADIDIHVGAASPHSGHEVTSWKGAAYGYAPLNDAAHVPTANLGYDAASSSNFLRGDLFWSTITWANVDKTTSSIMDIATRSHTSLTDIGTTTHANIDVHIGAASPHSGHEVTSNKGAASGYAPLNSSLFVPTANLGSGSPSSSNFLRGDSSWAAITWANIDKTTSSIADITTRSHTSLTDIGTNSHAAIDTAVSTLASHIIASSVHGATSSPTANLIILRDASGRAQVEEPSANDDIANKSYCDKRAMPAGSIREVIYHDGVEWVTLAKPDDALSFHLGCMKGVIIWDPV